MINFRLFFLLYIGVIISAIAGVLFHESGHWMAHAYYGTNSRIGYSYNQVTKINGPARRYKEIEERYNNEIENGLNFPLKSEYVSLKDQIEQQGLIITSAGPLFTWLDVTIAVFLLLIYKKRNVGLMLSFWQWMIICITLFCVRNIYGLGKAIIAYMHSRYKNINEDEFSIADYLGWNVWSIPIVSAIIAALVIWFVIFGIIPKKQRLIFFLSGLSGLLSVLFLWLIILGPKLMP